MLETIPYGGLDQWLAGYRLPDGHGWAFLVECPNRDDDRLLFSAPVARRWATSHGGTVNVAEVAAPVATLGERNADCPDRVSAALARRARSADWLAAHPLPPGGRLVYQVTCPEPVNNRLTFDRRQAAKRARRYGGVVHPAVLQTFDDVLEPEAGDFDPPSPTRVAECRQAMADVGLPLDMSARKAGEVLHSQGFKFRNTVIAEAMRQRRGRLAPRRKAATVADCLEAMAVVGLVPGVSMRAAGTALRQAGLRFRNTTINEAVRQWKTSLAGPQPGEKVA